MTLGYPASAQANECNGNCIVRLPLPTCVIPPTSRPGPVSDRVGVFAPTAAHFLSPAQRFWVCQGLAAICLVVLAAVTACGALWVLRRRLA